MKTSILVDTNVFIDVLGPPTAFLEWSIRQLVRLKPDSTLVLSPIVWAELAGMRGGEAELTSLLARFDLLREALPFPAAYQAGLAHRFYRGRGGLRERTLPDFLIGAHADHAGHQLLTRDGARYASYFPRLRLITPETHP